MQKLSEGRERTGAGEDAVAVIDEGTHLSEAGEVRLYAPGLRAGKVVRPAPDAGEETQQVTFEFTQPIRRNRDAVNRDVVQRAEFDQVEAANGREGLILAAD